MWTIVVSISTYTRWGQEQPTLHKMGCLDWVTQDALHSFKLVLPFLSAVRNSNTYQILTGVSQTQCNLKEKCFPIVQSIPGNPCSSGEDSGRTSQDYISHIQKERILQLWEKENLWGVSVDPLKRKAADSQLQRRKTERKCSTRMCLRAGLWVMNLKEFP